MIFFLQIYIKSTVKYLFLKLVGKLAAQAGLQVSILGTFYLVS